MSDADTLAYMGIDAAKWTEEFMMQYQLVPRGTDRAMDGADAWGTLISWFANAIEAGRTAGRQELCPHDWLTLGDEKDGVTLGVCRDCGATATYGSGGPVSTPVDTE